MIIKLGYFVSEFPMFTHVFFRREIMVLEKIGVEVTILSTKKLNSSLGGGHDWLTSLKKRTQYLQPFYPDLSLLKEFFKTSITRWLKVIRHIMSADDVDFKGRLYLIAAALMALRL